MFTTVPYRAFIEGDRLATRSNSSAGRQGVHIINSDLKPEMVLCIPGPWTGHAELVHAVAKHSTGYILAGRVLATVESDFSCEVVHETADHNMAKSFNAAGPHWRGTPEMNEIAGHSSVVYLVGTGGSRHSAEGLMLAALALLSAGGSGVKVESTGLAHSPSAWKEICTSLHCLSAHRALVVFVSCTEPHSCGMHNLGLRDAITDASADLGQDIELLRAFTFYLYSESPTIVSGQTFSLGAGEPIFRILDHPGWDYDGDALFTNPFGAWKLARYRN